MGLRELLHADAPAADRAARMTLYGQFIGSWAGRVVVHEASGTRREASAEVHFGWVLEGRAVQDVWIAPALEGRGASDRSGMYGTTLRVYDPLADLWHITWIDPVRQAYSHMTGRQVGEEIVQEYVDTHGVRCEWSFTEITANSFHWIAREFQSDDNAWKVTGEFFLARRAQ